MHKLLMASVLLTAMTATVARSEARWRIDVEGGAIVGTKDVEISEDDSHAQFNIVPGPSVAVGGSYGLGDWVDVTAHYQSSFGGFGLDSVDVDSVTAGGRVYLMPAGRIRPWVTSEIGWYHADGEVAGIFGRDIEQSDDSFGLNAGGGLDVFVNRRVSLGVDVRYHDAFDTFNNGLQFVTTMFNVGVHFGNPDLGF
jgi:hypothetical protein